jgi:hypothetical protein
MNIFVTSSCPVQSAKYLDNRRVVKMCLESLQILSTVINQHGGIAPYKSTHKNHPVTIWAGQSYENTLWLYNHFTALCEEYTARYDKVHKCQQYAEQIKAQLSLVPSNEQTPFVNCTKYKDIDDVFLAYKVALNTKWEQDTLSGREPKWN